jgi:hypothetical protein
VDSPAEETETDSTDEGNSSEEPVQQEDEANIETAPPAATDNDEEGRS